MRASALAHLQPLIHAFSATRPFELIIGVDLRGTSVEGLQMLLDAMGGYGRAFVFHNAGPSTFHPKLYRFNYEDRTEVYIGSGNLTSGGLFTNHEAGLQFTLHEGTPGATELLQQLDEALDRWSVNAGNAARVLDAELITVLTERGLIAPEAAIRAETFATVAPSSNTGAGAAQEPLFGAITVAAAPAPAVAPAAIIGSAIGAAPAVPEYAAVETAIAAHTGEADSPFAGASAAPPASAIPAVGSGVPRFFVMTLLRTDVGSGQTTAGTARRSPEIFVPLAARDLEPDFWGWPDAFVEDGARPGKFDRAGVPFFVNGQNAVVNMMTWPVKHDFRLRSEVLRSAGDVGDILRLERSDTSGIAYVATIIPQASADHAALLERCDHPVQSSPRRFGYY